VAFVIDNKETILATIDGWSGKLTYELLSEKLQADLGLKRPPSRHTYLKHDEIKHAFDLKKEELRNKKSVAIEEAKSLFESSDKLSHLLANLSNDDATIAELIKQVGWALKTRYCSKGLLGGNIIFKRWMGSI
jgi:predicted HAD superfamily phosphohydrolase